MDLTQTTIHFTALLKDSVKKMEAAKADAKAAYQAAVEYWQNDQVLAHTDTK